MNGQLEPACEACGDDVEPDEDGGRADHHFHNTDPCRNHMAKKIRQEANERKVNARRAV